ncbi:MAG: cupin domain-containing protein [Acetobacteraceae bacterium]|nr:cupin domain-containing protein [Acetobacteraceae bacterium]
MDRATFEAALTREGFEIVSITMKPDGVNPEHVHPFDARLLVLDGEITITRDGKAETFRPGDSCAMPANYPHAERVGPQGVAYIAGRRAV